MTRNQVRFLLGTPMIDDPFHASRWDYVYFLRIGRDPATIRRSTHTAVSPDQSIDEMADTIGSQIEGGIDQPIVYFAPPYEISLVERAAEAVATLDIDHQ